MLAAVRSEKSGLNLVMSSSRLMRRTAGSSSFLSPKNSMIRWLSSVSVLMYTKST